MSEQSSGYTVIEFGCFTEVNILRKKGRRPQSRTAEPLGLKEPLSRATAPLKRLSLLV